MMSVAVLRRGLLAQQRLQLRRFASLAASSCSSADSDCVGGSSSSGAQISPPPLPSANSSFYRRPLPASCVAFSSSEGKALFSEALKEGYMEAYFNLAEQFNTQDEPAYCGLSTLSMILNALEIDPGRTWKGPWRWYHESMLDCCVSLDDIKERGISYRELAGLARCNGAACTVRDAAAVSLEDFRRVVQHITGGGHGRAHLVINYDRRVLGQTGKGHFSPIGSYNSRHDMVLVMDTARFKYPPHWVPLETAWRAMRQIEETTGKGRGFMVFYRQERKGLVFTVCRPAQERWPEFVEWWRETAAAMSALATSAPPPPPPPTPAAAAAAAKRALPPPPGWSLVAFAARFVAALPPPAAQLVAAHRSEEAAAAAETVASAGAAPGELGFGSGGGGGGGGTDGSSGGGGACSTTGPMCAKISPGRLVAALEESSVYGAVAAAAAAAAEAEAAAVTDGGGQRPRLGRSAGTLEVRRQHLVSALLLSCVLHAAMELRREGRTEAGGRLLAMFDMMALPQILLSDVEHLTKSFQSLAGGAAAADGDCVHCINPMCPVDYAQPPPPLPAAAGARGAAAAAPTLSDCGHDHGGGGGCNRGHEHHHHHHGAS